MNVQDLLYKSFLIRKAEIKLLDLYSRGLVHGTLHTCIGQEMTGICLAPHLTKDDAVFSNHRGHGHYLSITGDVEGLIAEVLGREGGAVGGVGGTQHLQKGRYFSNGIQGGICPLAAGAAWYFARHEQPHIAVVFLGDGTLGQGVLYETLNLAARWKLPVLFVLEDNGWAQSTPSEQTFAGDLKLRIQGFGIEYGEGDTSDWKSLYETYGKLVARVRKDGSPRFVRVRTQRLMPHSKGDDLRPAEMLQKMWALDPLQILIDAKDSSAVEAENKAQAFVDACEANALKSPRADRWVFRENENARAWEEFRREPLAGARNFREELNQGFATFMTKNSDAVFIGEDVEDPYGGCFKVSRGLSQSHGERVRNTPISEAAIAGLGTGYSLMGGVSFVEFMFGDFSMLAMDQIVNHAAKFRAMYADCHPRAVFRTPMGGGMGYGPTHSQSLEKHWVGVPGLTVYALNVFMNPVEFLESEVGRADGPIFLAESKRLYGQNISEHDLVPWLVERDGNSHDIRFISRGPRSSMLLIAYGAFCDKVLKGARLLREEFGVAVDCYFPAKISHLSAEMDEEFFRNYDEILFFEEGVGYAGIASELVAQLSEMGLKARRWCAPCEAIPASPELERAFVLDEKQVVVEVLEVSNAR